MIAEFAPSELGVAMLRDRCTVTDGITRRYQRRLPDGDLAVINAESESKSGDDQSFGHAYST